VAWHRYEIAIVLSVVNFLTLWLVKPLKERVVPGREDSDGE
jgi:hypothetical protein